MDAERKSKTIAVVYKAVDDLIPYAMNSRTHSEAQVTQIAASIKEFGFTNPVLTDGDNGIIAGHGRVMAAKKLNMTQVPVIELSGLTKAQKKAYIIADNKIALNSGWDEDILKVEIEELKELNFDVSLLGFDLGDIDLLFSEELTPEQTQENNNDDKYTQKTDVFTYEPSGDKPELSALFDDKKTLQLIDNINKSQLSDKEKDFFRIAAYRHVIFDFEKIANYYAHSEQGVQDIMEESAMVIIDFDKAIAEGFVTLTKEIQQLVDKNG